MRCEGDEGKRDVYTGIGDLKIRSQRTCWEGIGFHFEPN